MKAKLAAGLVLAMSLVGWAGLSGLDSAAADPGLGAPAGTPARYSEMFYLAPTGYLVIDAQGRITESNLTAAAMLGVDWPTFLASNLGRFVTPDSQGSFRDHFQAALREVCKQSVELKLARSDGAVVKVRLESICVFDREGAPMGYRVAMSDLTPNQGLAKASTPPQAG